MKFNKKMIEKEEGYFFPKFVHPKPNQYIDIEGREIKYISIGDMVVYFYMKDGTGFKVRLEKWRQINNV